MMAGPMQNPPFFPSLLLRILLRGEEYHEFADDLNEIYGEMTGKGPRWRGAFWYWLRVLESLPGIIADKIYWRLTMFKNYLRTALRNLARHRGYSLINITGFAAGLASCLVIFLFVRQELSYDRYHRDADRIFRIAQDIQTPESNRLFAAVSPMVCPTLRADYPQVEKAARLIPVGSQLVRRGEKIFYEDRFMFADQEVFDILTIPFLRGAKEGALVRPRTLVLAEEMAAKYFGAEDPLGQSLSINGADFEITGVVADSPENTHVKVAMIASLSTLSGLKQMMTNWYSTMFYTYLKVKPGVDMIRFEDAIKTLSDPYTQERLSTRGVKYSYFLQPIAGIHHDTRIAFGFEPAGNPLFVKIFAAVGLFILLIACLNFMNLSTARATNRAKEVGLRKVVGAKRGQLVGQFLGESLLVVFAALFAAGAAAAAALPLLNRLTGITLHFTELFRPAVLLSLIAGAVLVGLTAGLYPALVLSSFRPASTLKGFFSRGSRGYALRSALVITQFTISVILIIGTLVMFNQYRFMKNQYLGFDKEQKLILPLKGGISVGKNHETVKRLFSEHASISGVTVSSSVPGRGNSSFSIQIADADNAMTQDMYHLYFDTGFIPEYGIGMEAGRPFRKDMETDKGGAFLINEAAVKAFGWGSAEEALGKRLRTGYGGRINPIIGVTKNFHYRGLQSEIEPLIMEYLPGMFRYITLSVNTQTLSETLDFAEARWRELFPGNPFESFFLDTDFERQYRADERSGRIFGMFTLLGLFIACLGLLGLASFAAETRVREIGIRKVLGASVPGIVVLLARQFARYVLLANLIAWPAAWFLMQGWLRSFAYRTEINVLVFVLTGFLVLAVAMLTVSFQSVRAAVANPADTLRHE
jgi:putative ABC transport system permease protein